MNPIGFLIAAVGMFAVAGGLQDWPWFWKNRRARFVTTILGRRGARIFYALLGATLVVLGVFAAVADM